MENKYIITVTAHCDIIGNHCVQTRYAMHDSFNATPPEWAFYLHDAKLFQSVEQAKDWFNNNKAFLFEERFDRYKFDTSSIKIQQIKLEDIVSISI